MSLPLEMQLISQLEPREIQVYKTIHSLPKLKAIRKKLVSSERVTIITPTNKIDNQQNIIVNFLRQTVKNKELIIILNNNELLNLKEWTDYVRKYENIRVFQIDEPVTIGACLNFGIKQATGAFIARFDDDDFYGPQYLEESLLYFQTTEASVVGKMAHFTYFEAIRQLAVCFPGMGSKYSDFLTGGTHLVRRDVFEKVQYPDKSVAEDYYFNGECMKAGFRLYSADMFNFVRFRRGNKDLHTWKIEDQEFLSLYCQALTVTEDPIQVTETLACFIKTMDENRVIS